MADHSSYHALGHGELVDSTHPDQPPPYGQQNQQWQGQPPPGQSSYGAQQQQHAPARPAEQADAVLAAQVGGMSLDDAGAAGTMRKKKKDRHAYHTVEAAGSSQAFHGMSPPPAPGGVHGASFANPDAPGFVSALGQSAAAPFDGSGGSPPDASVTTTGTKLSPDDLPSVPVSRDSAQPYYLSRFYGTMEKHLPPPATVSYIAIDQGNAIPKYARLTINNIPATAEALASTGMPLGLLLQPLAADDDRIPVVDFGESGPPRCRRCRAYVNPFMMFRNGGNKFVCNLCTHPNETAPDYFCATTPAGIRVDRDRRPELSRGTVEFVVPKEYWTREPAGMRWLFVIDVTQESYNKGFLEAFCDGILSALYGGDARAEDAVAKRALPEGSKVGFVTYDKDVHFYNVKPGLENAQMMIMSDIEDPFVPLGEGLFVDPYESEAVITSLLTQLPNMFAKIKNPEPALLVALHSAIAALENTGGKIICSLAALPTWGPGRLHLRDDGKHPGGEIDKKLLTTELPAWRKATEKMVTSGIGADMFLAAPSGGYLDVATVGHVSSTTGGETYYYPNFIAPRDSPRLALELRHTVTRQTGFQALMKIRCSNGLQIAAYHGNFVQHTFGADLEFGVIDADKAVGVTFSYDGKLDAKLDAHFQSALLYTTASGQRRVRCSNVVASVSENTHECIKFADQDATVAILAKEAATRLGTTSASLRDVRNALSERTIDILAAHRKHFAQPAPPSQLIMPDRLKELAMYMLCLTKTRAFKGGIETSDRRAHEIRMLRSVGALELSLYLYPRIIPIHNLRPEEGFPDPDIGYLRMPPAMGASFARVETGGVYLVDNGQQCILWIHAQTSPNLLQDLFGEDKTTLPTLDAYTSALPVLQTHLNAQVRNIVEYLRGMRGSKGLTIQLARQGIDGAEYEFARMLVEDRNNEAQSYVDWLVHLHKAVQLELSGHRKREDASGGSEMSTLATFAGLRPTYW